MGFNVKLISFCYICAAIIIQSKFTFNAKYFGSGMIMPQ